MTADTVVQISEDGLSALWDRFPSEPTRLIWCDWLSRHSIDPRDAAVPGEIVRDPVRRTVSYEAFKRDELGYLVTTPESTPVRTWVTVQLESPPLPFPEVTQ